MNEATWRNSLHLKADTWRTFDPGLDIEGLGPVKIPLKYGMTKPLIACCRVALYGKGTRTLVDTQVRKTYELAPKKLRLGEAWNSAVAEATQTTAAQLGLPADRLEAKRPFGMRDTHPAHHSWRFWSGWQVRPGAEPAPAAILTAGDTGPHSGN